MDLQINGDQILAYFEDRAFQIGLLEKADGVMRFEVDGVEHQASWAREGRKTWLHLSGKNYFLEKSAGGGSVSQSGGSMENILRAPMPGQVREVMMAVGDTVEMGDALLMLEAMKMEMRIQAPRGGKVKKISIQAGDSVEKDQILVEIEGSEA